MDKQCIVPNHPHRNYRTTSSTTKSWSHQARNTLLVITVLIVIRRFSAPWRIWQDDQWSDASRNSSSQGKPHTAGQSVMYTHNPVSYGLFLAFNSLGFFMSIHMVNFLTRGLPMQFELRVALIALTATYDTCMVAISPPGVISVLFVVISIVMPRYVKLPTSAANSDSTQAVLSKDVTLDADKKTWMRIYRPSKLPTSATRLPIILYFHPGGWIQMSVAESIIHESNNRISAQVPSILVAVEFRLAPEHRLPAQYDDAMDAIVWVKNQASDRNGDQWIRDYGDLNRCYLYGVSCGANIVYNTALKLPEMKPQPLKIAGTIMNQPFFGGKKRTKSELKLATDPYFPLPVHDLLWDLALPVGTDRDHRFCNPMADPAVKDKVRNLGKCLVIGFGGDPLVDRQQEFVQLLVERGVQVEARFDDVGFHNIDLIDNRRATAILNFIKEFV